jgi:glutathione synthase/RimK-type ligase-like ATP-grasp enzyme
MIKQLSGEMRWYRMVWGHKFLVLIELHCSQTIEEESNKKQESVGVDSFEREVSKLKKHDKALLTNFQVIISNKKGSLNMIR